MKNVIDIKITTIEAKAVLDALHDDAARSDGAARWFFERLQGALSAKHDELDSFCPGCMELEVECSCETETGEVDDGCSEHGAMDCEDWDCVKEVICQEGNDIVRPMGVRKL